MSIYYQINPKDREFILKQLRQDLLCGIYKRYYTVTGIDEIEEELMDIEVDIFDYYTDIPQLPDTSFLLFTKLLKETK